MYPNTFIRRIREGVYRIEDVVDRKLFSEITLSDLQMFYQDLVSLNTRRQIAITTEEGYTTIDIIGALMPVIFNDTINTILTSFCHCLSLSKNEILIKDIASFKKNMPYSADHILAGEEYIQSMIAEKDFEAAIRETTPLPESARSTVLTYCFARLQATSTNQKMLDNSQRKDAIRSLAIH